MRGANPLLPLRELAAYLTEGLGGPYQRLPLRQLRRHFPQGGEAKLAIRDTSCGMVRHAEGEVWG